MREPGSVSGGSHIGIRIGVEITNDLQGGPIPADWMFGPVESFFKKVRLLSPFWTGALHSSVAMEEDPGGHGWEVTAGDPEILNPITHTPTSEYAPYQEEEKKFMAEAYFLSGVKQKLDDASQKVFER